MERCGWSSTQPRSRAAVAGGHLTMIRHSKGEFNRRVENTFVSQLQKEQIFEDFL